MCGVLALLSDKGADQSRSIVRLMLAPLMETRGPDAWGIEYFNALEKNLLFGHARLSVVDVGERSDQPFVNRNSGNVLTFNGEIYNYQQLKRELEKSYKFETESDTEVLLAALEVWGVEKALGKIKGMFAFCYLNKKKQEVTIARDRFGEKPLIYGWVGSDFIVTSDQRVLQRHPDWNRKLSKESIDMYLSYRFVPAPYSIFEGMTKLCPGEVLKFSMNLKKNDELVPVKYWDIEQECLEQTDQSRDFDSYEKKLKEVINETLDRFLSSSDVPMGCFLSGGLDSSLVMALAQKRTKQQLQAFTLQFDEDGYDETLLAKELVKELDVKHWIVPFSFMDFKNSMKESVSLMDEPLAVHSYFPLKHLAKFTKQHVKVCLSGDGGDELFAGYNRYIFWEKYGKLLRNNPLCLKKVVAKFLNKPAVRHLISRASFARGHVQFENKLKKIAQILVVKDVESYYRALIQNPNISLKKGVLKKLLGSVRKKVSDIQKMMIYDSRFYLPNDVLSKVDKATMAHGLEARAPLLDIDVVRSSMLAPLKFKIHKGVGKRVLHSILSKEVPSINWNRPKSGFTTPVDLWMRRLVGEDQLVTLVVEFGLDKFISKKALRSSYRDPHQGEFIFTIFLLTQWLKENEFNV